MARFVQPSVFLIAETQLTHNADSFLAHLGVPDWKTDAPSDAEKLIEMSGKMCYNSFDTKLNKNLTRVRECVNNDYIQNGIIKVNHGSVLEHPSVTFALCDVSRIFTHELVRHRAGTAFSQTSGRYVRSDELLAYNPDVFSSEESEMLLSSLNAIEILYQNMETKVFERLDLAGMTDFNSKKKVTSALRRIMPNGQVNNIMFTANHRALRHICNVRTHESAEEEIKLVFEKILKILKFKYPNIYEDM